MLQGTSAALGVCGALLFRSQGYYAAELWSNVATLELAAQKAHMFVRLSCARCYIVSRESHLLCWCRRCCDFSHLASETEHNNATVDTHTNTHTTNHIAESLKGSFSSIHPSCDPQLFSYTQSTTDTRTRTHTAATRQLTQCYFIKGKFCSSFLINPKRTARVNNGRQHVTNI